VGWEMCIRDSIYSGPRAGWESDIVYIYLQHEGTFKKVFEGIQSIIRAEWHNEKLHKLYLTDWGCCSDVTLKRAIYQVSYDSQNLPQFEQTQVLVELRTEIIKPKSYLKKPLRFSIDHADYKLRFAPEIDDSTPVHYLELTGNTMLRLPKGAKGTAYGSKTDDTERVWWYVAMDPATSYSGPLSNLFGSDHVVGWLSSRYVTKLAGNGN